MKNLKLDRTENELDNSYNELRGTEPLQYNEHEGYLKCKLIHSKDKSLIIPDLIYRKTGDESIEWIQFYSFLPCLLTQFSQEEIFGSINVDIAFGHVIRLTISTDNHLQNLPDNSNVFKCRIQGPKNIDEFTTGTGKLINGIPYVNLYHHTLPEFRKLILKGSYFKCSSWNYQGTKELLSHSYCYFTSLPSVSKPSDLKRIAMSSNGKINLLIDLTNEVIEINVYRESTDNRTATIEMLIDSTILENNHIWEHQSVNGQVHYEIFSPFIYRIGVKPNSTIEFNGHQIHRSKSIKLLNFLIIGDAKSNTGIVAPFDEEETESIFKIEEFPNNDMNILKFWFDNGNTDQYSRKDIEKLKIKSG